MRSELTRSRCFNGPNWRGVGRVEVHADVSWADVPMGATLVVDFDHRSVASGGRFLVVIDDMPELLQFRRSPRGLRARVGGQWVDVTDDDQRDMAVIGLVLTVHERTSNSQADIDRLHQLLGNSEIQRLSD